MISQMPIDQVSPDAVVKQRAKKLRQRLTELWLLANKIPNIFTMQKYSTLIEKMGKSLRVNKGLYERDAITVKDYYDRITALNGKADQIEAEVKRELQIEPQDIRPNNNLPLLIGGVALITLLLISNRRVLA